MTDHIPLPPPDYTEDVQGFVHDTQRHYYAEETMRAYAERLHAARVNGPAIMQAIGLLAVLQSWIGPRRPEGSEPEDQSLWDRIETTRNGLMPLAPAVSGLRQQRTVNAILHLLTREQMAEEIVRLDLALLRATTQAAPAAQGDALIDAASFASDVLAEVYAKYQPKIGPFASQAQLANVRLRDAIKGAARSQATQGESA